MRHQILTQAKRVVVKVGSSLLASRASGLQIDRIERLADEVCAIKSTGRDVLLVSSGAIVSGVQKLGLSSYPKSLPLKQAAA
ncbi:MAG: glutamate 5-kinase, partial [Nitrospira sp.]|nr:glutamate 5-kinase [Nitrospira sp.]